MSNFKKITLTLALAAACAVGTPALAAVQTVDAVGYTFSFDDGLWGVGAGTTFSSAGNVFTFSNLGYDTGSSVTGRGERTSSFSTWLESAVTVTAKSGYQITGLVTGSAGQLSAMSGSNALSAASAYAFGGVYWSSELGSYKPTGASAADAYAAAGSSDVRAYSTSEAAYVWSGTTRAVGSYQVNADTSTYLAGSAAFASIDAASFSVAVSPVPEPESFALLLSGLALLGAATRRRKHQA